MNLWDKGFEPDQLIEQFTVGADRDLDLALAPYDVQGSLAHIKMLHSIGLLTADELQVLTEALNDIAAQIERNEFEIEPDVEDVHSQVEFLLTRRLGSLGKKIHAGRSRNDQVSVDLKLFYRAAIRCVAGLTEQLFDVLQQLSEKHKDCLMPGYTHLQMAMPSSAGLWFGAYAETLVDDMELLLAAHRIANQNPLGSAAGYGSSFPLDRQMTTELLGFRTLHYNVVAAQMSRGKTEQALAAALAAVATTLGRLAGDVCLFMCSNFAFVSLPDRFTTGSSIMPHKKNPDVFEIMRGRCSRLQALPGEVAMLLAHLPQGYNRDLQLLKDITFPAITQLEDCLNMAIFILPYLQVKEGILNDERYDCLFTVEEVNRRVNEGTPFRDAYRQVGIEVQNGTFKASRDICHTHLGSIGNLANDLIRAKMTEVVARFDRN